MKKEKNNTRLIIGSILLLVANIILGKYLLIGIIVGVVGYILMKETDFESENKFLTYFSYIALGVTTIRIFYFFIYMIYHTN